MISIDILRTTYGIRTKTREEIYQKGVRMWIGWGHPRGVLEGINNGSFIKLGLGVVTRVEYYFLVDQKAVLQLEC